MTIPLAAQSADTVMGRIYNHFFVHESSAGIRILLIVVMAALAHVAVKLIRHVSEWLIMRGHGQKGPLGAVTQKPKFVTVTRLAVSGVTFVIYFVALGLIVQECGFSLTTYMASASVVGLAISFGSQGLVQDIVMGLTLIFWDAMDVNDMVEVAGATGNVIGRVEEIGMRYTKIVNFYNQRIFIPNRTIGNVSRFPQGGADAYADAQIPDGADPQAVARTIAGIATAMWVQFGAIILSEPGVGEAEAAQGGGWKFVRVHFKIWPGQWSLIEVTFRQQLVKAMRAVDPSYSDWQVPVTYRAGTPMRVIRSL
ncbi:MAG: mechanosensitive ion channel domain-containing protein [Opitutaceae bacterium]